MPTRDNPLYGVWQGMRYRCENPNNTAYKYYGGRGIKVCPQWSSFRQFEKDMGKRPLAYTLERIDNNGHYEPSNCKWASRKEQMRNRRVCVFIEIEGAKHKLSELAECSGLKGDTIKARAKYCKTLDELIDPKIRVYTEGLRLGIKASSIARKTRTHCKRGHEFTEANTGKQKGGRFCRRCDADRQLAFTAKKRL